MTGVAFIAWTKNQRAKRRADKSLGKAHVERMGGPLRSINQVGAEARAGRMPRDPARNETNSARVSGSAQLRASSTGQVSRTTTSAPAGSVAPLNWKRRSWRLTRLLAISGGTYSSRLF